MFTISRLQHAGLFDIFENLIASHPSAFFGAGQTRTAERRAAEALACLPPHLRADAGLPPVPPQELEHPAMIKVRSLGRNWG